jgi:hypothetical protein
MLGNRFRALHEIGNEETSSRFEEETQSACDVVDGFKVVVGCRALETSLIGWTRTRNVARTHSNNIELLTIELGFFSLEVGAHDSHLFWRYTCV